MEGQELLQDLTYSKTRPTMEGSREWSKMEIGEYSNCSDLSTLICKSRHDMGGIRHSSCGHVGVGRVAVCTLWETRIQNMLR